MKAIMIAALALLCTAQGALASTHLNGVKIDGMTDISIDKCSVRIDQKGDVFIVAPGYEVQAVTPQGSEKKPSDVVQKPSPKAKQDPVKLRYFLVAETNAPGMTQYDVDLFINNSWVKRISNADEQTVFEVSKHLHQGKNSVHLAATKITKGKRASVSAKHTFKIMVGVGLKKGDNLNIQTVVVEKEYSAAQSDHQSDEFVVTGR